MSIICTLLSTISCLPLQEDNECSDGPFPSYYVERVCGFFNFLSWDRDSRDVAIIAYRFPWKNCQTLFGVVVPF